MVNTSSETIHIGDSVYIVSTWSDSISTFELLEGDKGKVMGYNEHIGCWELEIDFEDEIYIVWAPTVVLFRR